MTKTVEEMEAEIREALCAFKTGGVTFHGKVARGLLAALDTGNERFAKWRIHRNDSPELGQDMWREVLAAIHAAMFPEDDEGGETGETT